MVYIYLFLCMLSSLLCPVYYEISTHNIKSYIEMINGEYNFKIYQQLQQQFKNDWVKNANVTHYGLYFF